jgi:hypothetical protein
MTISSHRERAFELLRDKAREELMGSLRHVHRICVTNAEPNPRANADEAITTLSAAIARYDETIAACDAEKDGGA